MKANAILDMYSAFETAREAYDKAEFDKRQKEIEAKAASAGKGKPRR